MSSGNTAFCIRITDLDLNCGMTNVEVMFGFLIF